MIKLFLILVLKLFFSNKIFKANRSEIEKAVLAGTQVSVIHAKIIISLLSLMENIGNFTDSI